MKQIFLRGTLAMAVVLGGATAYAQMGARPAVHSMASVNPCRPTSACKC